MRYEVVVPVPVRLVWGAFHDPDRLAACLPVQPGDVVATATPTGPEITGRLRLRAGATTITYRGRVCVTEDELPLALVVIAEGAEARGGADVKVVMTVRLDDEGRSTRLVLDAALTASGRTVTLPPGALRGAAERLADRFAENLTARLAPPREPEGHLAPFAAHSAPAAAVPPPGPGLADAPATGPAARRGVLRRIAPAAAAILAIVLAGRALRRLRGARAERAARAAGRGVRA